ncbi:hypothetical protein PT974_09701 [Cladobotryum mycophilum]|uniref:SnoaL-like domain-containing protein n=1 Tax=Cladobotryum mycophilum TaxID=491253 RepID=A0ABR0SGW0_9HYPO
MSAESFQAAHEGFINAVKARDHAAVAELVSPAVKIFYRGEAKEEGVTSLLDILRQQATKVGANIKLVDTKELAQDEAVQVTTNDGVSDTNIVSTYYYSNKHGKWLLEKLDTEYDWNL